MNVNFNGMRKNATDSMNELADVIKEVIQCQMVLLVTV